MHLTLDVADSYSYLLFACKKKGTYYNIMYSGIPISQTSKQEKWFELPGVAEIGSKN